MRSRASTPVVTASASTAGPLFPTSAWTRGRKPRVASRVRPGPKTAGKTGPQIVSTPVGDAGFHLDRPAGPARGLVVLGHGAGGGVEAADLLAATTTARAAGWAVARVVQPYRLAGRRSPAPAQQLDAAWSAVLARLRKRAGLASVPLVVGGRSSGARVACRTAADLGAQAVLALAFPLHPPGRPERGRAEELINAGVPVNVVQGDRDAFGTAADIAALQINGVDVREVSGADHGLRNAAAARVIADVVAELLSGLNP